MKFVKYQWLLCLSFLVPHDVRERIIYRCCKHEFASISQKSCSIWVTKSRLLLQTIVSQQITEAVKAECLDFEKLLCAKWFLCQSLKISLLSRLSVINIVHPTSTPATFSPTKWGISNAAPQRFINMNIVKGKRVSWGRWNSCYCFWYTIHSYIFFSCYFGRW